MFGRGRWRIYLPYISWQIFQIFFRGNMCPYMSDTLYKQGFVNGWFQLNDENPVVWSKQNILYFVYNKYACTDLSEVIQLPCSQEI